MAQKPTEAHSVTTILPLGFLPFASLPNKRPSSLSSRSKASLTSALPTAEQDLPVQTKTWWRMGAAAMGAKSHNSPRSVLKVGSLIAAQKGRKDGLPILA